MASFGLLCSFVLQRDIKDTKTAVYSSLSTMLKTIYGAKIADKFMDNSLQFMMRDLGTSEEHRLLILKCCCDLI